MSSRRPARATRPRPAGSHSSFAGLAALLIVLALAGTFWNSLGGPFIWDDQTAIVNNQTIRSVASAWSPPAESPVAGRPLANLSFALNYAVGGLNVTGYHLLNVVIHILCALLLFGVVRRTLEAMPAPPGLSAPPAVAMALVAALLWGLHPIQSEAVDYLTERTESLMALFFLLSLYCAIRARRPAGRRGWWEGAAVVSAVAAMATKETAVSLPLIVVLYDWCFEFPSLADALGARRRLYAMLAASWVVLVALMLGAGRSTVTVTGAVSPWTYALNQLQVVTHYLWLTVWPRALVLDYGLPRPLAFHQVARQAVFVAALLAAAAVAFVRWRRVGFLAVAFVLMLGPSSSIVPVVTEVGAERRMYLPFAALAVLAVVLAWLAIARLAVHRGNPRPVWRAAGAVAAVVLVSLAVRTAFRNAEYSSPVVLWQSVVDRWPSGRAHYSLGIALVDAGRHQDGIAEFQKAIDADFPDARFALATEFVAAGRYDDAEGELQAFIARAPERADRLPGRLLLGNALLAQGRLDQAAEEFQAVLTAAPSNAAARDGLSAVGSAHRNRAARALSAGAFAPAAAEARAAIRAFAGDGAAHNLLGAALASQGDLSDAATEFEAALRLNPGDQQARNNLARARAALGQPAPKAPGGPAPENR